MKTSAFLSPTQLKVWKKKKGFANLMWSIWCSTIGNISVWPPVTLQHPVRTWTNIWKYLKTYISYALLLFLIGDIDIWTCRLNHDCNDQYWRRHLVCLDFLFVYLSICLANLSICLSFPTQECRTPLINVCNISSSSSDICSHLYLLPIRLFSSKWIVFTSKCYWCNKVALSICICPLFVSR